MKIENVTKIGGVLSIDLVEDGITVIVDTRSMQAVILRGRSEKAKPQEAPVAEPLLKIEPKAIPQPQERATVIVAAPNPAVMRDTSIGRTVLATLREFGPLSTNDLCKKLRRETKQINDALWNLAKADLVERVGVKRRTDGFSRSTNIWRPSNGSSEKKTSPVREAPVGSRFATSHVLAAIADKAMTTKEIHAVVGETIPQGTVSSELHRLYAASVVDKVVMRNGRGSTALWSKKKINGSAVA